MNNNLDTNQYQVCRICTEEIINTSSFFLLDFTQANTGPTIGQKLSYCIPELDLSIVRNAIICDTCADIINFLYNFKNKCLRSELQIHKYIQQHIGDVDVELAEVTQFSQLCCGNDIESTNNEYLLSLQTVDIDCVLFNTDDVLFNYSKPATEENSNIYDNSITQIVDNQNSSIEDQDLSKPDIFYECFTCGHKTKSKLKLILHMKSHTGQKRHQKRNRRHIIKKNQSSIEFNNINKDAKGKCNSSIDNKRVIKSSNLLQKYLKSKDQFSQRDNLKPNMEAHMANKQFKCSVCEYRCNYRRLKQHMLIHTGEKPFACSFCEYRCNRKDYLKLHMRIHTGNKHFTCSVCERKCTQKSCLKNHMLIHTGDKPFACSVCEYRCRKKSNLENHKKIHTGEKPFRCSVCEYQCIQKSALNRHMKRHTD